MLRHIINALKGFLIGASNVIPGVSGGTMAVLTGIYGRLVDSIASLSRTATWKALFKGRFREFWQAIDGAFLLALGVGVLLSVASLAKLVTFVFDNYPIRTWAFFFGLVAASAVVMFKGMKGWKLSYVLCALAGVAIGVGVSLIPEGEAVSSGEAICSAPSLPECLYLFLCGAVAICTMILPGVSGSFMLLVMGRYEYVMNAISGLVSFQNLGVNLLIIGCFGVGALVGILAFARFLHWLLARWEKPTMTLLLGFIIGSLVKLWPWNGQIPDAAAGNHVPGAILFCLIGAVLVLIPELVSRYLSMKRRSDTDPRG